MTPIPLSRVDFVTPVSMKGGTATGLTVGQNSVTDLSYDLDTLTVKLVRTGHSTRVPTSNVKSMVFVADDKKVEPVVPAPAKK